MTETTQTEKSIYDVISNVLLEISKDKEQQREIDDLLSFSHKIPRGTFDEILVNPEKFEILSQDEQVVFSSVIFTVTKNEDINPINFYNTKEIKAASKYKRKAEQTLAFPISYNEVLMGSETDYVFKMSYKEIAQNLNEEFWTYNFLTQRNPVKTVRKDGSVKLTPKLNRKSVNEIKQLMLDGKYLPDSPIVINVLRDGSDEIFYNEDVRELTIESASEIDLLDGYHRSKATQEALEENPDLEGYLYVSVRNYDLETARFYLGQHNSFNTFDKTHVRQLKSLKVSDKIVEDLISKSDLKGRITTSTAVKRKFKEITNFAIMSDSIRDIFDPTTGKDRLDISYALTRFYDYLFGSYPEQFVTNVEETWNKSWINHHNTFVLYNVVAHRLYTKFGKDFPLDEITRIVDSIDFTKDDSGEFNKAIAGQGKINSNQIKRSIRKFAEEKMDALLS